MHTSDKRITLVEVGPRDGLQSLSAQPLPTAIKLEWIQRLAEAGLQHIEVAAFVHPQKVPAMADADTLCQRLMSEGIPATAAAHVTFSALTPNEKGLERAIASGIRRVAVFTAASSAFTEHNIGMSVESSLQRFEPLVRQALDHHLSVRGYVSTIVACPYSGKIQPEAVARVAEALLAMGCDEVSLGETLGVATPLDIERVINACVTAGIPLAQLAFHPHDTYGMGIANVQKAVEMGISTIDSSAGGLGGCPYAPGAAGNVATEDVVYLLENQGYTTGVDLPKLVEAGQWLQSALAAKDICLRLPGSVFQTMSQFKN